jgi:hypothetical protein
MSFRLGLSRLQEAMVIALMLVIVFALNSNIELSYKISIAVLVFTIIVLSTIASEVLKQQKEQKRF